MTGFGCWGSTPRRKDQPFGIEAGQYLSAMIRHKQVRLICVARDRYRRMLCNVCRDGREMSHEMVIAGLAWALHKNLRPAQTEAKAAGRGLWADPKPVKPRTWRKKQKVKKNAAKHRRRNKKKRHLLAIFKLEWGQ